MISEPRTVDLGDEDYYAFLNIPRNASDEEISNAYRRLSRMYHPDKHSDLQRKKEAELLFSKTKKAYEVLKDPHMRAIYDSLGTAGLETQGWEVVQRTKTPQEIRKEYEQLARDREEQRLQHRTNPKSSVGITINATELFTPFESNIPYFDLRDLIGLPHIEISGLSISQSIEAPLTTKDTAIFSGSLSSQNGTGSGWMTCCARRILSENGWGEIEFGAGDGVNVSLKGFRKFSRHCFGNTSIVSNFSPDRASIGTVVTLANQLDEHTVGYLTWKTGMMSGMSTMVIRDTNHSHIVGALFFGIPHTYCALSVTFKVPERQAKFKLSGRVGTFGGIFEYSAEKKISRHSSLGATVSLGIPTGVSLKIRLHRTSQSYTVNFLLCEELIPAPIIYGTAIPLLAWVALQKLIIQPYLKEQKHRELQKQREANRTRLSEKKTEAHAAVELMKETVKRIVDQEEASKGLVILQSLYGCLIGEGSDGFLEDDTLKGVIEITIPLQCLVRNSKLILHETSKSQLPGFYDPCPGEEKYLNVRYLFRAVVHQVIIKDKEPLRIPKQSHRLDT